MEFLLKEWEEMWIPELVERDINVSIPKRVRKILTFSGIRRSGKTYMMFQLIKQLSRQHSKESIFYVNFEDERIERKKENLTNLVPSLIRLYGNGNKEYFLFLDEVQVMPEWSKWLRRIHDTYRNINLFVSGSSAKVSSREIPTELRGRALNFETYTLSFKEFLKFKGTQLEKDSEYGERKLSILKNALDEHIKYGGFPEVVLEDSEINKRKLIQEYYSTIVARDISERNKVKKFELLHDFLRLLLSTNTFSINRTFNILKSQNKKVGKETLIKYAKYCEDAYFCFFIPIFSYKIKNQMKYQKKVYFADNSFLSMLSLKFSKDLGRLYENIVFIELKRDDKEVFYWRSQQKEEVDFVVKHDLKVKELIQVCYNIEDYDTKKREIKALLKASKELKCNNLIVITENKKGEETIKNKKIQYITLLDYLLSDAS